MMSVVGFLLRFVPKNHVSYFTGLLVHLHLPKPFSTWTIKIFSRHYKINEQEAEKSIDEYPHIGAFFVRKLKPGARPISEGLIHPVDGDLTRVESIQSDTLIQAKGHTYSINKFLNYESGDGLFNGGTVLTYYLCPTDYHRTHSPVTGNITSICYIPGNLWPVNSWSVKNVESLFSVNERVVIWIKNEVGTLAYVMVGATNVGKMSLSFDLDIVTNQAPFHKNPIFKNYTSPIAIKKGDELGAFNMGSTVIALYSREFAISVADTQLGPTKLGEPL